VTRTNHLVLLAIVGDEAEGFAAVWSDRLHRQLDYKHVLQVRVSSVVAALQHLAGGLDERPAKALIESNGQSLQASVHANLRQRLLHSACPSRQNLQRRLASSYCRCLQ